MASSCSRWWRHRHRSWWRCRSYWPATSRSHSDRSVMLKFETQHYCSSELFKYPPQDSKQLQTTIFTFYVSTYLARLIIIRAVYLVQIRLSANSLIRSIWCCLPTAKRFYAFYLIVPLVIPCTFYKVNFCAIAIIFLFLSDPSLSPLTTKQIVGGHDRSIWTSLAKTPLEVTPNDANSIIKSANVGEVANWTFMLTLI